ncbi:unnamed protein product [Oreochromis niloticus]|nr:unnamed protein product [Mustela putorius furo]
MTFEWTRPDLEPRFVFVWRTRQDLVAMKNPSYKDRSSLFTDELKHGNISLKLSKVKPADEGRYRCYIPAKDEEAFIDLVVASGAVSSPVISLEGIDRDKTGVMLECKSEGWHPEPELLWLDGEGNLLSAGPTETLRGPDDLYTVSSRVTVEKRHSNNITCRVQQRNTNQIRETQKHVSDELFQLTSSSAAPVIIGVVVSLAVIILILIGVFFIWRRNKKKKKPQTETDQEQETLMTQDIKPVSDMTESDKTTKHEEKQETDKKVKEDEKQDIQQVEKKPSINEVRKKPETSKLKTQRSFQEQNKSSSANNSSARGDIILDKVDTHGQYICLKNTSSENKLMGDWEVKLQVNETQPVTFKVETNFTLKAGERLTLHRVGAMSPYLDDAEMGWMGMTDWEFGDDLKISLISNTGEEHRLK